MDSWVAGNIWAENERRCRRPDTVRLAEKEQLESHRATPAMQACPGGNISLEGRAVPAIEARRPALGLRLGDVPLPRLPAIIPITGHPSPRRNVHTAAPHCHIRQRVRCLIAGWVPMVLHHLLKLGPMLNADTLFNEQVTLFWTVQKCATTGWTWSATCTGTRPLWNGCLLWRLPCPAPSATSVSHSAGSDLNCWLKCTSRI